MIVLIDGENLVFRYQALVDEGKVPRDGTTHIPDTLVWHDTYTQLAWRHHVLRATYYTYCVGDDQRIREVSSQIKGMQFGQWRFSPTSSNLSPVVLKKHNRSAKRKGVDIRITVEALSHAFRNNADVFLLLSGDGDYVPLVEELRRTGKQVYVSAFSHGLNTELPQVADQFYLLDGTAFSS